MGRLICDLHRPGMTSLHRAGLAGLYMTLEALNRNANARALLQGIGLRWALEGCRVSLDLPDDHPMDALSKLIELSFQVDSGFFKLPGLERGAPPTLEQKILLHQSLLSTFLQHPKSRAVDKSTKGARLFRIDERSLLVRSFSPIISYKHQLAKKDLGRGQKRLRDCIKISGPLFPGGAQRHTDASFSSTSLEESPELFLPLLYAPIGAIYFRVFSRRNKNRSQAALLIPSVHRLDTYAQLRRFIAQKGALDLSAASPSDAALQVAVLIEAQGLAEDFDGTIRVMCFGTVPWSKQQKSRTAVMTISPAGLPGMHNYEVACGIFRNRWQTVAAKMGRKDKVKEPEHAFVRPYAAREIIAENVANGRHWYANFADWMMNEDARTSLQSERKELYQMTQKAEYDHPNERIFIRACHEAWRRRLGHLGERSRRERIPFARLANNEYDKQRVALAHCKNAVTLRTAVTDFWSRAGSLPALQEGWVEILPLLEEDQWQKARDLALLALASYQPSNDEEQKAMTDSNSTTDLEGAE